MISAVVSTDLSLHVKRSRSRLAVALNGLMAADALGFPVCNRLVGIGSSMRLQRCAEIRVDISMYSHLYRIHCISKKIKYRLGKTHQNADCLSDNPVQWSCTWKIKKRSVSNAKESESIGKEPMPST